MIAPAVFLVLLAAQPATGTYEDIVALQSRAAQAGSPTAAQDHRRSIEIAQRLGRPRLLAVLFQRLGRHLEPADVQEAVIAYEAGFKALRDDPTLNVASELDRMDLVPKGQGSRSSAVPIDLYSQPLANALETAEADDLLAVNLLLDIGNAYFQQPQLGPALDRYQMVLARPEITTAPKLRAYALANAGEILRRQGDVAAGERMLREALALLRREADPVDARRALVLLAGIHRDRDEEREALVAYTEALALYARTEDARGEGRAHGAVGRLHLHARRLDEARRSFARAVDLGTKAKDDTSLWHAHWGLGQVQQLTGDGAGAMASLEKSLSLIASGERNLATDEGKVAFLDSAQQVFDQLISLHVDRATREPTAFKEALSVAERARAGAMRQLMGVQERHRLICPADVTPGQKAPPVPSPMSQLARNVPAAPIVNGAADPRCAKGRSRATVTPPALSRLVFHVLADRTLVVAELASGETRGHVAPLGFEALATRVAALRRALDVDAGGRGVTVESASAAPAPDAYRPHFQAFYRELIEPLASAFAPGETLAIEPHGPLWLIPFAALEDAGGRPLVERWPIVYSPSAEILDQIRREPPYAIPGDVKALIVGNPVAPNVGAPGDDRFRGAMRATFQPLPGAEAEARAIASLIAAEQHTILIGADASLRRIESQLSTHSVVHLASHALAFADQPLESFVMLTADDGNDGQLTARRVLNSTVFADLVTLSACQTGMGYLSGDGVIGLSRSFLARGARSVLVSGWSVSDTATAALMRAFYTRYLAGTDKGKALQQAMIELRSTRGYDHPKFWAPFVLVGSER
jgi:CHAT domain-containing protein/tetratricopeptide (TPR) repeat protein